MQDIKLFYAIYFSKLCFVWVLFVLVCLGFCLFVCLGFQVCFLLGVLALQHHVFLSLLTNTVKTQRHNHEIPQMD